MQFRLNISGCVQAQEASCKEGIANIGGFRIMHDLSIALDEMISKQEASSRRLNFYLPHTLMGFIYTELEPC